MLGVILDADSLGPDIDLSSVTGQLDHWHVHGETPQDKIAARISDADIVVTNKVPIQQAHIAQAKALKFISVTATGTNNIDLGAAHASGIAVSNAVGYGTPSVVQHTMSLIMLLSNNMHRYLQDVANGKWQQSSSFCLLNHPITEISGKQLGIIGYGELGRGVAMAAQSLGMTVVISERPGTATTDIRSDRMAFEETLATSDFLSLHCPLTADNLHLINQQTLSLMPSSAFLINTARGGLIDSMALLRALDQGTIAGAAVDVLAHEPATIDEPLINHTSPKLLVTPHNAWGARESRQRLIEQTSENIKSYLSGKQRRVVSGT